MILAAGAINSPKLLELSGIGRPDVLGRAGHRRARMSCRRGREPAGSSADPHRLQGHERPHPEHSVPQPVSARRHGARICAAAAPGRCRWRRASSASSPQSDPRLATPDLEYHVQPLSTDRLGEPLHRFPAITVSVCNLRPESRGTIHMRSADAGAAPKIRPNYLSTEGDRHVAADSIRHARRLMQRRALAALSRRKKCCPGAQFATDAELAAQGAATSPPPSSIRSAPAGWARPDGGGRRTVARPWPRRAARRRRLDHARHRLGQHQFAGSHDRRTRSGLCLPGVGARDRLPYGEEAQGLDQVSSVEMSCFTQRFNSLVRHIFWTRKVKGEQWRK